MVAAVHRLRPHRRVVEVSASARQCVRYTEEHRITGLARYEIEFGGSTAAPPGGLDALERTRSVLRSGSEYHCKYDIQILADYT